VPGQSGTTQGLDGERLLLVWRPAEQVVTAEAFDAEHRLVCAMRYPAASVKCMVDQ